MRVDSKFLSGDPLDKRWVEFREGFEVRLAFPEPSDWTAFFAGRAAKDVPDAQFQGFLAKHVDDWRGLEDETGQPVPFDPAKLLTFLRRDARFNGWLFGRLSDVATFRRPTGDGPSAAAGGAPETSGRVAA